MHTYIHTYIYIYIYTHIASYFNCHAAGPAVRVLHGAGAVLRHVAGTSGAGA